MLEYMKTEYCRLFMSTCSIPVLFANEAISEPNWDGWILGFDEIAFAGYYRKREFTLYGSWMDLGSVTDPEPNERVDTLVGRPTCHDDETFVPREASAFRLPLLRRVQVIIRYQDCQTPCSCSNYHILVEQ